jgi:DNA-binding transcriptional LysR family regulator
VAGLGFAALPKLAVASDIASGLLKRLPVPPVVRSINAVRRQSRGGPAQEAFWGMLTGADGASSGKMPSDGRINA